MKNKIIKIMENFLKTANGIYNYKYIKSVICDTEKCRMTVANTRRLTDWLNIQCWDETIDFKKGTTDYENMCKLSEYDPKK